jgi:hypothetical protein
MLKAVGLSCLYANIMLNPRNAMLTPKIVEMKEINKRNLSLMEKA